MKRKNTIKITGLTMLSLFFAATFNVSAAGNERPGEQQHPAYLHALSDLRAARWMLQHRPGNWKQTDDEISAVKRIDMAIAEIKKASIDDGKDIFSHPKVDERPDRPGRLHAAADYLLKARKDVNKEEDNDFAKGLRNRALDHISAALSATANAIKH